MTNYYVLVKRKAAKNWMGALPSKKGITKKKLQTNIRQQIKKAFTYKIITAAQLKNFLKLILKRSKTASRKKTKRKKRKR